MLHPAAWALLVSGGCKHSLEGEEEIPQESLASGTHRKDGALHRPLPESKTDSCPALGQQASASRFFFLLQK